MLLDHGATGLGVTVFETEEDMRRADAALNAMSPAAPGGRRTESPFMRWPTSGAMSRRLEVRGDRLGAGTQSPPCTTRAARLRAGRLPLVWTRLVFPIG